MQDYHAEFVEIYNKNITRPGADRLLCSRRADRRCCRTRPAPAKRRLFCAERRHFDDHAHPIAWADRPRRARRHKPTGAFPSSPADASAACFRPLGAACVPERQRRDFACFLVAADAEGLSPFSVHAFFLPSRRGQPSADGGRVTAHIFLVRTVRMFGCSDSVPITST